MMRRHYSYKVPRKGCTLPLVVNNCVWLTTVRLYHHHGVAPGATVHSALKNIQARVAELEQQLNGTLGEEVGVALRLCVSSSALPCVEARAISVKGVSRESGWVPVELGDTFDDVFGEGGIIDAGTLLPTIESTLLKDLGPAHPSPSPARSVPSHSERSRATYPANSVVVDFAAVRNDDDIIAAKDMLTRLYPRLRLHIQHTSGSDIQNTRTHTFSVSLRPRVRGQGISEEESTALTTFVGESIGTGYHSGMRRALQDAFRASSLTFPTALSSLHRESDPSNVSLMSLYREVLGDHGAKLTTVRTSDNVKVTVTRSSGELLYAVSGKSAHAWSLALSAAEAAAQKLSDEAARRIRRRIDSSPLVIVLPDTGIRIKRVLRRVLGYYYGIAEADIDFHVTTPSPGVFHCAVMVPLPSPESVHRSNASLPTVALGEATSTSKKISMRMAATQVLRKHFTRLFTEQLEFHPEVQELLPDSNGHGGITSTVCPPFSRGLKVILDWAIKQENIRLTNSAPSVTAAPVKLSYLTQRLTKGQRLGQANERAVATVWATMLSVTGSVAGDSNTTATVCPLSVTAVDFKKSKSEQKAFAAALAQRYGHMTPDAVMRAVQLGLITQDGEPTVCTGMSKDVASPVAELREVPGAHTDPFIQSLVMTPTQRVPLDASPESECVLSRLRSYGALVAYGATDAVSSDGSCAELSSLRESIAKDGEGRFIASLHRSLKTGDLDDDPSSMEVLSLSSSSPQEHPLCALIDAYTQLANQTIHNNDDDRRGWGTPITGSLPEPQEQGNGDAVVAALAAALPASLNEVNPFETVCRLLQSLYGGDYDLHMYGDEARTTVELWRCHDTASTAVVPDDAATTEANAPRQDYGSFIAIGHGSNLQQAAASCAADAFRMHIGAHHRSIFPGQPVQTCTITLQPTAGSLIHCLTDTVITEIAIAGSEGPGASCCAMVELHYHTDPSEDRARCVVSFSARTGEKRVELEQAVGRHVLECLCLLGRSIALETSMPFHPSVPDGPHHTAESRLQAVVSKLYGVPLVVETTLSQGQWYSRVSLPLDRSRGLFYCLATGAATRKKEAVDLAAQAIWHDLFESESSTTPVVPHSSDCSDRETVDENAARHSHTAYIYKLE